MLCTRKEVEGGRQRAGKLMKGPREQGAAAQACSVDERTAPLCLFPNTDHILCFVSGFLRHPPPTPQQRRVGPAHLRPPLAVHQ